MLALGMFIKFINREIDLINLIIKKVLDQETGGKVSYLVLCNKTDRSSDATKLASKAMADFVPYELEYLRIVVDCIMTNENCVISQTAALNRVGYVTAKRLNQQEAEKLLLKLRDHGWLRYRRCPFSKFFKIIIFRYFRNF
jgi:hypothetical protein